VVIERRYSGAPVYLRVPEGHRRHWSRHCNRYNACGRQVYFVQDGWYQNTYAPRYRDGHYGGRPAVREQFYREPHRGGHRDMQRGPERGPGRDDHRGDRGEHGGGHGRGGHDRDDNRGNGHGR
jgi:hypothetical protein